MNLRVIRRTSLVLLALSLPLSACEDATAPNDPAPDPVTTDSTKADRDPCADYPPPFTATYLPPGFTLGSPGAIGTIEGGFSVEFAYRNCEFRMDTYGISRGETRKVAGGLKTRS